MKYIYIIFSLILTTTSFASEDYMAYLKENKNIDMFSKEWKASDEYEEYKLLKNDNTADQAKKIKEKFYEKRESSLVSDTIQNININIKNTSDNVASNLPLEYILLLNKLYKQINKELIIPSSHQKILYVNLYYMFYYTYQNNSYIFEFTKKDGGLSETSLKELLKKLPQLKKTRFEKDLYTLAKKSDKIYFDRKKNNSGIIKEDKNGNKTKYTYYKDGSIKSKVTIMNGKKNGYKFKYYKNNKVYYKLKYIDDKREGECVIYHKNGTIKSKVTYINDKRNGTYKRFYDDGKLRTVSNYINGKVNGLRIGFHKNGNKMFEHGVNSNNELVWIDWNENGGLDFVIKYKKGFDKSKLKDNNSSWNEEYKNSFKIGKKWYREDGTLKSYAKIQNNKLNGSYIWYFKNGKISEERTYKNGKAEGKVKSYFADGKLYLEGQYKDDKKVGTWKYYSILSGSINKIINYKDNVKHGLYTKYYPILKELKSFTINYKNGKRDGKYTEYTYDKHISKEIDYKNGKKVGKYIEYAYSTKISKNIKTTEINYQNSERVGKATWWYFNGKIKKESIYKNNKLDGIEKEYQSNGLLTKKSTYKNGQLQSYKKYQTYGLKDEIEVESKKINKNTLEFVEYRIRYKTTDKKLIYAKWKTVNGLKDGKYIQYDNNGNITYVNLYKKGISLSQKHYDSSGKIWSENVLNPSTKLYKKTYYSKKGKITEIFSHDNSYNKIGKHTRYSPDGKIVIEDIYDKNGKLVSSKNFLKKDLEDIVKKYKNNRNRGLAYYWLDLEKQYGFDVDDANDILDNLVSQVKRKVTLRSSYSKYQAKDIMNIIGQVILDNGIIYDTKHINIFSKTLENKAMDCDIISILYVTIGDRLHLPIYTVFYPGHMALKWKDGSNSFYWEATAHKEMTLHDYKKWILYEWNATSNIKKYGYATEMDEQEVFSHIFHLLSFTIQDNNSKKYFRQIAARLNNTHNDILNVSNIDLKKMEKRRLKLYGSNDYMNNYYIANSFYANGTYSNKDFTSKKIIKHLRSSYKYIPRDDVKILSMNLLIYAYKNLKQYVNVINIYEELIEVDYSNRSNYNKKIKKIKELIEKDELKKEKSRRKD